MLLRAGTDKKKKKRVKKEIERSEFLCHPDITSKKRISLLSVRVPWQ